MSPVASALSCDVFFSGIKFVTIQLFVIIIRLPSTFLYMFDPKLGYSGAVFGERGLFKAGTQYPPLPPLLSLRLSHIPHMRIQFAP